MVLMQRRWRRGRGRIDMPSLVLLVLVLVETVQLLSKLRQHVQQLCAQLGHGSRVGCRNDCHNALRVRAEQLNEHVHSGSAQVRLKCTMRARMMLRLDVESKSKKPAANGAFQAVCTDARAAQELHR